MKIGDNFIAEKFNSTEDVWFNIEMEKNIKQECNVCNWRFDLPSDYIRVRFKNGDSWTWKKSALKPI